jgi:hypothetical protein
VTANEEREFHSASRHATVLAALLGLNVVGAIAVAWVTLVEIDLLRRVGRGEFVRPLELTRSDERSSMISGLSIALLIVTGIVWLLWQHRSQANLHARRVQNLKYTPGWAVGWWLIPFANLVMPFLTVRELWGASGAEDGSWSTRARTWPVIGGWWASWIAANLVGRVAAASSESDPTVDSVIAVDRWILVTEALSALAAILAILIVRSVAQRQSRIQPRDMGGTRLPPRPDVADGWGAANP